MSSFQEGVKQGGHNHRCHQAEIVGPCKIIYRPHKPNGSQAGGARLWIEVEPHIQVIRKVFPDWEIESSPPEYVEVIDKHGISSIAIS
ncbi:MAG: hypothetical protein F6K54_27625 [Okeania sp. SIO3B5]|uniref:hypothetical protein n=1 Tax=Okeania sp. SIO3B5 TaxID=2607811 RepID=UPI001400F3BA|nr:hypothetical protein [Okeania sp. SIO3B5]NEO56517.1 hypothetical protein [Okeania sp. SIO3B5]